MVSRICEAKGFLDRKSTCKGPVSREHACPVRVTYTQMIGAVAAQKMRGDVIEVGEVS